MRYAIISDIHGNREALDTVLERIEDCLIDEIVCLGDIVGYGADPGYCLDKVREVCSVVIAGNHDFAAVEKISIEYFNTHAKEATLWTRNQLSGEQQEYLRNLPLVVETEECTFVHGSLDSPELFDYVQTSYDAFLSMEQMKNATCFIGHSHVPITFMLYDVITYTMEQKVDLSNASKSIVNVGSVGQPRDHNPKASFVIYDTETQIAENMRIAYDIEISSARIREAGLPDFLADRLKIGR